MKIGIREQLFIFITVTLAPLITYVVAGIAGYFGGLKAGNAMLVILALLSLSVYFFISFQKIRKNEGEDIVTNILYYVNFLIYMIAVLISFNLIVIAGFLYTDQVPMGLEIDPSKATLTLILGIYILIISSAGMYYLSYSRRKLRSI